MNAFNETNAKGKIYLWQISKKKKNHTNITHNNWFWWKMKKNGKMDDEKFVVDDNNSWGDATRKKNIKLPKKIIIHTHTSERKRELLDNIELRNNS